MELRSFARTLPLLAAAVILVLPLAVQAAKPSGGGGSKVSVTAANPSDAFQGEELDVIVSGSGFDAGSQVSYLVTGTTDASQVEVLSVEFISSSELKTRIRPKDAALPTEYDIQVQTSSGRKGKGTTLFRVKVAETACTGTESKIPEVVFLTDYVKGGSIETQDMYLSTGSGCDQTLLLEDAVQVIPVSGDPRNFQGEFIKAVTTLRMEVKGNMGVVTWVDTSREPSPQMGMLFSFDGAGNVTPEPGGPWVFHEPAPGWDVNAGGDVRINDQGEIELILNEVTEDRSQRLLVLRNLDQGSSIVLGPSNCHAQDQAGNCYTKIGGRIRWSVDGSQFFTESGSATTGKSGILRFRKVGGSWQDGEVLMTDLEGVGLRVVGLSSANEMAYRYTIRIRNKNGKVLDYQSTTAILHPDNCAAEECLFTDGVALPVDIDWWPGGWTREGGLLFLDVQAVDSAHIRNYSNPYTGEVGRLFLEDVDYYEADASY
jgi:hypothetical protein